MIPVFSPAIGRTELGYVMDALLAGDISGSGGPFLKRFEEEFAAYCGCRFGVAVSSGTAALHLATTLARIQPGDEVLVSACTNIASANAVAMRQGIVVPVDSEPDTWNMDVSLLDALVTPRTRAIMPVHIYGHPVDMDEVLRVAEKHDLFVIEDCAEAHGALYRNRKVGGIGTVGCFSFYANKIITTGEGGMLVTNDEHLAERARSLRNLAFGKPRFLHREIGFNYRLTNIQAAIGCAQFERINETLTDKRRIATHYTELLRDTPGLRLPVERDYARNVYWMYALVVEESFGATRNMLIDALAEYGVETRTMFCPMKLQPALVDSQSVRMTSCPVAEELWERGLYLPSTHALSDREIDAICHVIQEVHLECV